ncbi:hypothetical protein [Streptomyces sp. NRRL S-337]|uniref:hypothetical protein n=1 Tax=Streptomyces sp. NRRL S-337 TaxID=1463900 RepID=UPI0004C6EB8E|nr:hypothetical protein [Streptomyces sp. NRRL S-337]
MPVWLLPVDAMGLAEAVVRQPGSGPVSGAFWNSPVAQSELAALTRRFEENAQTTDREFGIVKSDLTALRLQVGTAGKDPNAG